MLQSISARIKQRGYSLLEMLIGIGLGVFLLGGSVIIYTALMRSYYQLIAVNRLDQQLRTTMSMMVQEIRRAGYSATSENDISSGNNSNPFMATANDITVPISTCILFTYDTDSSGSIPALNASDHDKRYGFRLSNGAIQSRASTDSSFNCDSGNWINLTDPSQVAINNLNFTLTPTTITLTNGVSKLTLRNVTISLTGSLVSDNTVSRTILESIRVRNDKFQP